ncbi:hypothetical protein CBM2614_A350103 [Cupriavidus taiwanensis]|nr:hypothetical protein CBM2614_A350103 [Cupriavidus taiwanensis]
MMPMRHECPRTGRKRHSRAGSANEKSVAEDHPATPFIYNAATRHRVRACRLLASASI